MTNQDERSLLYKILTGILTVVITVSVAVSSYFIKENINSIAECKKDIMELKLVDEKTKGSLFTTTDFIKAKDTIDQQQLLNDRRLTILEENFKQIKTILDEIKTDVKDLKQK